MPRKLSDPPSETRIPFTKDMKNGKGRLLRTDDIRRYLQDKKGEIKERTRRWSMCSDSSDCSVQSNSSIRSLPQYSSYRAFSSKGSLNKMSGVTPGKAKSTKVVPRGQASGSKDDVSSGRSSGIPTPGAVSRENSFTRSQLPVMQRESSIPKIKRESSIPQITRESSIPKIKRETSVPQLRRDGSKTPSQTPSKKEVQGVVKREGSLSQIKLPASSSVKPRTSSTNSSNAKSTDDLKIGDRVNINGTPKNGVIQFIGETRFAKGIWTGVVLDEAVGKNDGTVSGVRYFQCQPNYGVFVKLEKLKKLADVTDPNYKPRSTPASTPVADRFSQLRSAERSSTPVRTPDSTEIPKDLNIGDKVSIGDARTGILRYLGETGFAKGIWCGVELQEPVGKNDGAVAGTRYFQCEPKYGLFAPAHKIKKIADGHPPVTVDTPKAEENRAAAVTPEETVVPVKAVETEAQINETASNRDSSYTSQIASMQIQLQDRENEIKQLLKEREAGRAEFQAMLEQYQQAENKITSLRISQDKLQRDNDQEIKRLQAAVASTEKAKASTEAHLEEEKRKLEDLQFQLEELLVTKELSSEADRESVMLMEEKLSAKEEEIARTKEQLEEAKQVEDDLKNKNSDLEFLLAETNEKEIQSTQSFNVLQSKLKDLEEALNQAQSESDNQSSNLNEELSKRDQEIASIKDQLNTAQSEKSKMEFEIKKYREELNETIEAKGALNKTIFDMNAKLEAKDSDFSSVQSSLENLKAENQDNKSKLKAAEIKIEHLNTEKDKLEQQATQLMQSSGNTSSQLDYLNEELKEAKSDLVPQDKSRVAHNKDLVADAQTLLEENLSERKSVESERRLVEELHCSTLEDEKSDLTIKNENLKQSLEQLQDNSKSDKGKIQQEKEEQNKLREELKIAVESVSKYKLIVANGEEELKKVSAEHDAAKNQGVDLHKRLTERDELLKRKDNEILSLTNKVKDFEASVSNITDEQKTLKDAIDAKSNELLDAKNSKEELEKRNSLILASLKKVEADLGKTSKDKEALQSTNEGLCKEIQQLKFEKNVVTQESESKDERLRAFDKERCEIEGQNKSLNESLAAIKQENDDLKKQLAQAMEDAQRSKEEVQQMESTLSQGSDVTSKLQNELSTTKAKLLSCGDRISSLEDTKSNLERQCQCLNEELNISKTEHTKIISVKDALEDKVQNMNLELEQSAKRELEAKKTLEDDRLQLQNSIELSLSQLQQKEGELSSWRVKAHNYEKRIADLEVTVQTLQSQTVNGTVDKLDDNHNGNKSSNIELEKELEDKESEVRFLNSLVVDLQNKYKAAEDKIRILETGEGLINDFEELNSAVANMEGERGVQGLQIAAFANPDGSAHALDQRTHGTASYTRKLKSRWTIDLEGFSYESMKCRNDIESPVRPGIKQRLFCDICDEFDLHDTEDCPTQSSTEEIGTQYHASRGEEREYCTICEAFGHKAEDCDDEETF